MATVVNQRRDERYGEIGDSIAQATDAIVNARRKAKRNENFKETVNAAEQAKDYTEALATGLETGDPDMLGDPDSLRAFMDVLENRHASTKPIDQTNLGILGVRLEGIAASITNAENSQIGANKRARDLRNFTEKRDKTLDTFKGLNAAQTQADKLTHTAYTKGFDLVTLQKGDDEGTAETFAKNDPRIAEFTANGYTERSPGTFNTEKKDPQELERATIVEIQKSIIGLKSAGQRIEKTMEIIRRPGATTGIIGEGKLKIGGFFEQLFESGLGKNHALTQWTRQLADQDTIDVQAYGKALRNTLLPVLTEELRFTEGDVERVEEEIQIMIGATSDRIAEDALGKILVRIGDREAELRGLLEEGTFNQNTRGRGVKVPGDEGYGDSSGGPTQSAQDIVDMIRSVRPKPKSGKGVK